MRIAIVEDHPLVARGLEFTFQGMGHEVCGIADTVRGALDAIERHRPDLITCDVRLRNGESGLDVARAALTRWRIRTLFITAAVDRELLAAIGPLAPVGCIAKGHLGGGLASGPFDEAIACALSGTFAPSSTAARSVGSAADGPMSP